MLLARTQGYVLTIGQLSSLGFTRSASRNAVRTRRWTSPAYGVIAPVDVAPSGEEPWLIARRRHALAASATVLRHPDHVVCARSAAVLHGLPTLALPASAESTAPPKVGLGLRSGSHVYGAWFAALDMTAWHGVAVSTVARTVIDLARHDRRDGVIAADAALREGLTSHEELEFVLDGARGWPGVRQARTVCAFADARAESPLESLTRLALHDDGFPAPELQSWIGPYRVDLCWPQQQLVLEVDGRVKYSADALWAEKRREAALRRFGFRVERVIWADVTRYWPSTAERLRSALAVTSSPSHP